MAVEAARAVTEREAHQRKVGLEAREWEGGCMLAI